MIGYRAWRISGLQPFIQPRLSGLFCNYVWQLGPNLAECKPNTSTMMIRCAQAETSPPHTGGSCGLWCMRSLEDVEEYLKTYTMLPPVIIGTVNFWGRIIEHDLGLRSEYAEITGLYYPPTYPYLIGRFAEHYDVPVFPDPQIAQSPVPPAKFEWSR
jgi:hypothetical protein